MLRVFLPASCNHDVQGLKAFSIWKIVVITTSKTDGVRTRSVGIQVLEGVHVWKASKPNTTASVYAPTAECPDRAERGEARQVSIQKYYMYFNYSHPY